MWISKRRWNSLCERVSNCEKEIKKQKQEHKENLLTITKRILREPKKLSEELDGIEHIECMIKEFINS